MSGSHIVDQLVDAVYSCNINYQKIDALSEQDRNEFIEKLFLKSEEAAAKNSSILLCLSYLVPKISNDKRYETILKMVSLVENSSEINGKAAFQFLEPKFMRSLGKKERLDLATLLKSQMQNGTLMNSEKNLWGLVRIIPHLHELHQKQFAQDIYLMIEDTYLRNQVLEALCNLVFSLNREERAGLTYFFGENLKKENGCAKKYFIIELLENVSSSLPENDRLTIADCVAPLLYNTDHDIARKSLDFFSGTISFLPSNQRSHYAQMISALVNDLTLKEDVLLSLEKIIPHITIDEERKPFENIMRLYASNLSKQKVFKKNMDNSQNTFAYQN